MMNNYFGNPGYFNQGMGMNNGNGFAPQTGLVFGQLGNAKPTSSTNEELDTIRKSAGQDNFNFSAVDDAIASWDLREGTNLCIQLVDPETDRVRIKYTNDEFNIVMVDDAIVNEIMTMVKNLIYTTKLINTGLSPEMSKELYRAGGLLMKLLPTAYAAGRKNYNNVMNLANQQVNTVGYNGGQWGNMMFNGQFGTAPSYVINDNPSNYPMMPQPQFGNGYGGGFNQPQQVDPNAVAQVMAAMQMMGNNMGAPTAPNGGTMMGGGNPFVQGGQPQQVPQMNVGSVPPPPSAVPFPGQPVNNPTPNPSIGQPATTATSPF